MIANTEVDIFVFDGPTAVVTVVRMIEADVGDGWTALGAIVIVASKRFDRTDDILLSVERKR